MAKLELFGVHFFNASDTKLGGSNVGESGTI